MLRSKKYACDAILLKGVSLGGVFIAGVPLGGLHATKHFGLKPPKTGPSMRHFKEPKIVGALNGWNRRKVPADDWHNKW